MEQIDVIAYEKDLKKNRFKRLMHNKQAISAAAIGVAQLPSIFFNELPFFKIFGGVVIGLEFSLLRRYWRRERVAEETQTIEMLRTTTTYNELMKEYQNYIKAVADLVRSAHLESVKENVVYLHALMEHGIFARYLMHKYRNFEHEKDYLIELCGAKVVTGTSVCRHMSSFMADVINEMGYTAANISCTINDDDPVKRIKKGGVELDHLVLAFLDNGTKYLFDATNGFFVATPVDFDFTEIESIHVAQYVTQQKKKYLIVCPHMSELNFNREKQCEILNKTKLCKISTYEVDYIRNKIQKVLNGNSFRQFTFHQTHEPQRQRIEALYKELLPYSDEEITSHIVRK